MNSLTKRWKGLSYRERVTWLAASTLLLAGLYTLLVYPATDGALRHSENMINRKMNRIELRRQQINDNLPNVAGLESNLRTLQKTHATLSAELEGIRARFAPEDADSEQTLLLDISALAQRSGLAISSQGNLVGNASSSQRNNSRSAPPKLRDPETNRPIIKLSARGGYWEVLDFLDGLKRLPTVSSPIAMHLVPAKLPRQRSDDEALPASAYSALSVELTLTL